MGDATVVRVIGRFEDVRASGAAYSANVAAAQFDE
jgi:hypothetical protein